jgi:hypothetical protein
MAVDVPRNMTVTHGAPACSSALLTVSCKNTVQTEGYVRGKIFWDVLSAEINRHGMPPCEFATEVGCRRRQTEQLQARRVQLCATTWMSCASSVA